MGSSALYRRSTIRASSCSTGGSSWMRTWPSTVKFLGARSGYRVSQDRPELVRFYPTWIRQVDLVMPPAEGAPGLRRKRPHLLDVLLLFRIRANVQDLHAVPLVELHQLHASHVLALSLLEESGDRLLDLT